MIVWYECECGRKWSEDHEELDPDGTRPALFESCCPGCASVVRKAEGFGEEGVT